MSIIKPLVYLYTTTFVYHYQTYFDLYYDSRYELNNNSTRYLDLNGSFIFDNGLFFGANFKNYNQYSDSKSSLYYYSWPGYCYFLENGYLSASLDFTNKYAPDNTSNICYNGLDFDFFYSFDYARLLIRLDLFSDSAWSCSLQSRIQLYDNLLAGLDIFYFKSTNFDFNYTTGATWKPLDYLIIDALVNTSYTKEHPIKFNYASLSTMYLIGHYAIGAEYYYAGSDDSPSLNQGQFSLKAKYNFNNNYHLITKYDFENKNYYSCFFIGYEYTL